jgi:2-aminoadipate transaminase
MVDDNPLHLLSVPSATARSSVIRDLLEHAKRPGMISLAGGIPDPDLFPLEAIGSAVERCLAAGPDVLQYGLTPGEPAARAALSAVLGRPVDIDRVVVTTGSQQGLDLVVKAVIDPGDEVVVGDPSYLGALQAFRAGRAALTPLPVDEAGLVVEVLEERLLGGARPPKLVYVVVNFDNPTGATLSAPRRELLVALAERYGFVVVEDDPYGALRYDGVAPPPLGEGSDHVVRMRSTSKVLAPGLRIGWLEGPAWLVHAAVIAKQSTDLHTSTLSQAVVADLLGDVAWFEAHVASVCDRYRERRNALCDAIDDELGGAVTYVRPEGGMFVWGSTAGVDTDELLLRALDAGVAFVPGSAFAVADNGPGALRLSFATASPDRLAEGCRRLRSALA